MSGALLLVVLDLVGTFVFALSGALVGVRRQLDIFGVVVLAIVSAIGGGLLRDVLIGAVPPPALQDPRYVGVALVAGLIGFVAHGPIGRVEPVVVPLDAAGLGLFAVAGATKAIEAGLPAITAIALGVVTGVGGGVLRDLLAGEVPRVLRREVYAVAALLGAAVVVAADGLDVDRPVAAGAGVVLTFAVRMLSVRFQVHAPVARTE